MRKETLDISINAFNIASKDETRPAICSVHINEKDVVAIDGYAMAIQSHGDDFFKGKSILIHRDELAYLKITQKGSYFRADWTNEGLTINGKLVEHKNGTFPAYKRFIPSFEPTITIGLDAEILLSLAKALEHEKRNKKHVKHVKIEIKDNSTAFKVTINNGSVGVLMPVRV